MWRVVVRGSSGTLPKFSGLLIPIQLPQDTTHSSVIRFLLAVRARPLPRTPKQRKQNRRWNAKPTAVLGLSSAPE